MTEENAQRVKRQTDSPIFVIVGNPPYNAGQVDENDNNKNRKYPVMDRRVAETYAKDSHATNKNALSDPYVKAFRWASDRLGSEGIVAFVTNSRLIHGKAADGMRRHLQQDFDTLYILDLGGDVRSDPSLSGTRDNVFGIQVGVSINLLIRHKGESKKKQILYAKVGEHWTKEQKYKYLDDAAHAANVKWTGITPNEKHSWLLSPVDAEFSLHLALAGETDGVTIFNTFSNGVKTNRDDWAFNFDKTILTENIRATVEFYNDHVLKWRKGNFKSVDAFVKYDDRKISWSRDLKNDLQRGQFAEFSSEKIRSALYRPFTKMFLFFDRVLNEEIYQLEHIFPPKAENVALVVTAHSQVPFSVQMTECVPCVDVGGRPSQCFPYYIYSADGGDRRENITDCALDQFRSRYHDSSITKWDIFHYIYGVMHHPKYRERYAANLRRELPRIPFAAVPGRPSRDSAVFRELVNAGQRLAEIHVHYEEQLEYQLTRTERRGAQLDWRVSKLRLSKDKATLFYNEFLTLSDIPKEAYDYRLGNRSAIEWIVDQYQVSTDKRSGIANDPK